MLVSPMVTTLGGACDGTVLSQCTCTLYNARSREHQRTSELLLAVISGNLGVVLICYFMLYCQVPSDIEEEVVAERQRSNAAASASTQDGAAAVPDSRGQKDSKQKKAKKETGKKRKAGGSEDGEDGEEEAPAAKQAAGVRLSTGVQLLDPSLALQHANAKARQQALAKAQAEGLTVVEAEALKPYPPLMQSFMVSQGFLEPTPIQVSSAALYQTCRSSECR